MKKQPLLEVKNLSITFQPEFEAVKNISFELYAGEVLGIVGESGSGKSVTALSIPDLLANSKAQLGKNSSISLLGKELIGLQNQELQRIRGGEVGFIFQEPMSSLNPLHKIGEQIAETMIIHQGLSAHKAHARAIELLKMVGIKNPAVRYKAYPFELSGGQRQRVMIAMAIANNPKILIADEPTTALDVTIQEQIINLLIELKKKIDMSIIFISHDLRLVHKIADRILVMYQGKIVESGSADDVFANPRHKYTRQLLASSMLKNKEPTTSDDFIIEASNLQVQYPVKKSFWGKTIEEVKAVDNISLQIGRGETLCLVGESGSGKTTLGMCLAKLIRFKGDIKLKNYTNEKQFRRRVQIVFQDPYNSLNPRLNVLQIVSEGLKIHFPSLKPAEIREKTLKILSEVGLSERDIYKYPHEFSGGQRQRIAIARALILNPEVIILDEPTSALDVTVQAQILDLLKTMQKKHKITYVFISHDMNAVRAMADTIAVMKDGKIIEQGTADCIIHNPSQEYTKTLINASFL